jgi:hypothetical protein
MNMLIVLRLLTLILGYLMGRTASIMMYGRHIVDDHADKTDIPLYFIEYDQGFYYLYKVNDQSFAGQATTLEGLATELNTVRNIDPAFVYYPVGDKQETFVFIGGEATPVKFK